MTGAGKLSPERPSLPESPLRVGTIWTFDLHHRPTLVSPLEPVAFRRAGVDSVPQMARALVEKSDRVDGAASAVTVYRANAVRTAEADFTQRLSTGRRCYAAWAGERLAAYGWVSFVDEQVGELGLRLTLEPGEAYIWDCYTLPDFRQKRLYSALLGFILEELRAGGLHRAWIGADLANTPSQLGIDRAGFTRVADLLVENEENNRRFWAEGYPGVPESLVSAAERVFLGSQ